MNKKIAAFVIALLALGALEFGLLGASASGLVGGSSGALPPISQRGIVQATGTSTFPLPTSTPTPASAPDPGCAISPPQSSPPCSSLAHSIELDQPVPSAIACDGFSNSLLHVTLRNQFGNVVDDGTPVQFSVFNGSPSPYFALTKNGQASTSIVVYSDAYSYQPNVTVRSGEMETAIRLRCRPNSGCPLSPPASVSPPCGVQTPISPPICAPNQTSPPCTPLSPPAGCVTFDPAGCGPEATPTPIGPPSPPPPCTGFISPPAAPADCQYEMRLDADPAHSGIQTTRRIVGDQPFTIGIDVTKVGKVPYAGYQWDIAYVKGEFAFISATEHTAATGLDTCVPPTTGTYFPTPAVFGGGAGCITLTQRGGTLFTGETTSVELRCLARGTFALALASIDTDPFGAVFLDYHGSNLPTTTAGITIDCQVGGTEACADVTGDGRVTRDDLRFIIRNISRLRPDLRADVNGDGRVDGKDLSQATKQLGKRC